MNKRTLGRGLEVTALGFGCMGLNFSYGHALANADSVKLIREAHDVALKSETALLGTGASAGSAVCRGAMAPVFAQGIR